MRMGSSPRDPRAWPARTSSSTWSSWPHWRWLVWPATVASGARDAGSAAFLAIPVMLALLVTRPWRRLSSRAWLLAPAVAVAALLVVPATGVGRNGAVAALAYVLAPAFLLAVAAYARTPARRVTVAVVLCAGGVAEFAWALVPWWGGGDPARAMVGTYFWHNQLAVALLLPALLGLALAVSGRRPWRSVGWVTAPVCAAGVVLSTSRATLLCLAVGWVAVITVALLASTRRRAAVTRALVVTLLAVGLSFLLPGPPLFSTSASPLSGAAARAAAGETLDANATYRTEFWRESAAVFSAHPFAGAGYGRMSHAADGLVPTGWARSPLAHDGPLQALAEGGLLLGLPFLLGLEVVGLGLLRRLRLRGRTGPDHVLVVTAAVAGLGLLAHSLVDIDWTYPGLLAQLAVVSGLALAVGTSPQASKTEPDVAADDAPAPASRAVALSTGVLVLALAVGTAVAWSQPFHIIDGFSISGEAHS